jgi:hypothetical protein
MGDISIFEPAEVDLQCGTYAPLVAGVPLCAAQPVFCGCQRAVAAMMMNFTLSRQVVFPSS